VGARHHPATYSRAAWRCPCIPEIASRAPNNASILELPLWNPQPCTHILRDLGQISQSCMPSMPLANGPTVTTCLTLRIHRQKAQSYCAQWRLRSRQTCIMRRWKEVVKAFARDVEDFVLDFVDLGHFALETHVEYFIKQINKLPCCARRGKHLF